MKISDISKSFGKNHVLNNVNFKLQKGEVSTLVGANGTGKTTLFNIITGFINADNGDIFYNGKDLTKMNTVGINKLGISRTFQDLRIIHNLSVMDNILLSFKNNPGEIFLSSMLPQIVLKNQYTKLYRKADRILEKIQLAAVTNSLAGNISFDQPPLFGPLLKLVFTSLSCI